jgi:4-nitrophenyl phosphatase
LRQFGIFAEPEQVLPSTIATAAYLAENFPPGARVYVLGESGLLDAVEEAGFQVANERVDAVVVGLDRNFTYRDIQVASNHILQGAKFIACNADSGAPKPDGIAPGAGAITAAIEAVTMVPPIIVGKPEPAIFLEGIRRMGLAKIQVAAIGDRLDIDVACARKAEVMGILVLTGMTDEAMVGRASTKPDLTFQDLTEFTHAWQEMLGVGSP